MTGPGTHITCRCRLSAHPAVLSAPLRSAASTRTVPRVSAAIRRLRARKRGRVGAEPGRLLGHDGELGREVLQQ